MRDTEGGYSSKSSDCITQQRIDIAMNQQGRAVTPVISTILMVAIVVILAATVSVFFLGVVGDINEPAPNVADTTGEFEPQTDISQTNQIVRITHIAGEGVPVEELEIIIRASGPGVDAEERLYELPASGNRIKPENKKGDDLVSTSAGLFGNPNHDKIIINDDSNVWASGDTIQFRIKTGAADFREGESPEAAELEVVIVHTPSNAIISEHKFRP
ncbi:type IV pilin N-terminal domain-containing protein [Halorubrum ezzemoulense]|uniref:type IV pilin N-terminal domain-containing protein n=1 Tax=Halorubrum ezzemoulense TaxID=337243 RepID=UPI002330C939|nr:type IV pilin N-terminal domain-containing protein [Halorubrum ezzemoulense]MDB2225786.1 type IV pilin N-terminal domain-containing protein [Halorubrum ezzemoulense]